MSHEQKEQIGVEWQDYVLKRLKGRASALRIAPASGQGAANKMAEEMEDAAQLITDLQEWKADLRRSLDALSKAFLADVDAHLRGLTDGEDTYPAPRHGWTCFHCGETFKTEEGARIHFGETPSCAEALRSELSKAQTLMKKMSDWFERATDGEAGSDYLNGEGRWTAENPESGWSDGEAIVREIRDVLPDCSVSTKQGE